MGLYNLWGLGCHDVHSGVGPAEMGFEMEENAAVQGWLSIGSNQQGGDCGSRRKAFIRFFFVQMPLY
ncbi:hypothetical protein, variant [Pyricularia oryzae 70-15]|uniref:Uncharacterized protein n=1 Tax=Pyricularia oryzae (strain 70-15 / ATCC MYA-4617 / FGSC 8958) TaxID=242507 RepID=G4MW27_PYRO7|nr:hypothetical protein, variant [Pyricularia oryzae 70-15]EHA54179.1 hypothetical protein, variant [Pyricularia oryzae 70-15]